MGDNKKNGGDYQLRFAVPQSDAPFGFVGVRCDEYEVIGVDYLPKTMTSLPPQNYLANEVAKQLRGYFAKPRRHRFDLPLRRAASQHQQRARECIVKIAPGATATYQDIAKCIKNASPAAQSCAQAVGGACRCNLAVLVVPCHRVVATNGIGGFGGGKKDMPQIKQWLLKHEGVIL